MNRDLIYAAKIWGRGAHHVAIVLSLFKALSNLSGEIPHKDLYAEQSVNGTVVQQSLKIAESFCIKIHFN